jgi:uncharacterized protein (DUF58 family)
VRQPVRQPRLPFAPTRRLALAVLAVAPLWLLSAWPWGAGVALAALGVVLAAAAADAARTPGAAQLALRRELPATAGMGDATPGRYVLDAAWPAPVRARVADRLPPAVARGGPPLLPLLPAPGGGYAAEAVFTGRARGAHALGPAAVVVDGPLGLARRAVRFDPGDVLTVAPSTAGVRRLRLLALQHRLRDAGVRQLRRRGGGSAVTALREYAPGDDPRRVDWKASARRDALVVRETGAEQGQTVVLAVDAGRLMTQLVGPARSRFDAALDSALVLADVAARGGDRVGLLVFDEVVRAWVPPAQGAGAVARVRAALVPVQPVLREPDYAGAFRALAERNRRRSLVVLFTDVIDARASRALLAHVARGAARHVVLVVALRDEQLDAAARPGGAGGLYESAAAEEVLGAREEALQRMRQAGVAVLDTPVGAMTAGVVNRYLELKARSAV